MSGKDKKRDADKVKPMDDPAAHPTALILGATYRVWKEGRVKGRHLLVDEIKRILIERYELLDLTVGAAEVMHFDTEKYGRRNWQLVDNAVERFLNAGLRHHLHEVYYPNDVDGNDKESRFPHKWHAACSFAFALWFLDRHFVSA